MFTKPIEALVDEGRHQLLEGDLARSFDAVHWSSEEQIILAKEQLLSAVTEIERLQRKFWNVVKSTFGCEPSLAWQKRMMERPGGLPLEGEQWWCHFHGVECDVQHRLDGRCVRLELILERPGLVNASGLDLFLRTTRAPWLEFPNLRELVCLDRSEGFYRLFWLLRELVQSRQLACIEGFWFGLPATILEERQL